MACHYIRSWVYVQYCYPVSAALSRWNSSVLSASACVRRQAHCTALVVFRTRGRDRGHYGPGHCFTAPAARAVASATAAAAAHPAAAKPVAGNRLDRRSAWRALKLAGAVTAPRSRYRLCAYSRGSSCQPPRFHCTRHVAGRSHARGNRCVQDSWVWHTVTRRRTTPTPRSQAAQTAVSIRRRKLGAVAPRCAWPSPADHN